MKNYIFIVFVALFCSCGDADFFTDSKPINNQNWKYKDTVSFSFDVQDTINAYNIFIDMRNNKDYKYSDIYFFFDIDFPNGKHSNDTVGYDVTNFEGKWHGHNTGSFVDNHIIVKPNVIFPLKGNYKMHIRHAMRDDELKGIEDVGLSISSVKKK